MMFASKYQLLDNLGIPYWLARNSRSILQSNSPLFCARCLVLLPSQLGREQCDYAKVLSGMVKVLDLKTEEICVAWLGNWEQDNLYAALMQELTKWAPRSLLVMGEALAALVMNSSVSLDELRVSLHRVTVQNIPMQCTYHPEELSQNPVHKKKAYQDLLYLKDWISKGNVA